jgi:hypothetical protein
LNILNMPFIFYPCFSRSVLRNEVSSGFQRSVFMGVSKKSYFQEKWYFLDTPVVKFF